MGRGRSCVSGYYHFLFHIIGNYKKAPTHTHKIEYRALDVNKDRNIIQLDMHRSTINWEFDREG